MFSKEILIAIGLVYLSGGQILAEPSDELCKGHSISDYQKRVFPISVSPQRAYLVSEFPEFSADALNSFMSAEIAENPPKYVDYSVLDDRQVPEDQTLVLLAGYPLSPDIQKIVEANEPLAWAIALAEKENELPGSTRKIPVGDSYVEGTQLSMHSCVHNDKQLVCTFLMQVETLPIERPSFVCEDAIMPFVQKLQR